MSIPILTFFNNNSGLSKTSLIYYLSYMFAELGKCVTAIDLVPQANLTTAFLDEDQLEELWVENEQNSTINRTISPLMAGAGDILEQEAQGLIPANDPLWLSITKHFRILIPLSQEARKPIFKLTPADGAIGSHAQAAQEAYRDFKMLTIKIAKEIGLPI